MRTVLLAGLRAHAGRLVATAAAVVLSVAFLVGTLALTATFVRTTQEALTATMARADVRVAPADDAGDAASDGTDPGAVLPDHLPAVRGAPGVAAADVERVVYGKVRAGDTWSTARASGLLDEPVRWQDLVQGRWPDAPTEVTLDEPAARELDVAPGDDVVLQPFGKDAVTLTVVGLTAGIGPGVLVDVPQLVTTPDGLLAAAPDAPATEILVRGDGEGADVAAAVSAALGDVPGLVVQTRDEATERQVQDLSGSATVLTGVLLGFCVVTLVVAAIVIANTFHVLVAQRTRELALLRCIGAGVGQVHRLVLGEAAVLGLVASAAGVGVGLAGAHVVATTRMAVDRLDVTPAMAVAGVVVGVVLTVVAAWPPARRATRVRPVEALRPREGGVRGHRWGRVVGRLVLALLLLGAGGAGALAAARDRGLPVAVAAVVVSFLGVLVVAPLVVPGCVRAVGSLGAWLSAPARLAAANATRNPRRTTATATALLVGVTLVSAMLVATASVRSSVDAEIDVSRPVDLVVRTSDPAGLDAGTRDAVRDLPEVVRTADVTGGVPVRFELPDGSTRGLLARALDPDATRRVARADVPLPDPGTAHVHPDDAADLPDALPVVGPDGRADVVVVPTEAVSRGTVTLHAATLAALVAAPPVAELQVRLVPLDSTGVQQVVSAVLSLDHRIDVGGGAPERATYRQLLDTMLLGVLALLTLALVIAVVGIGNTLALSVVERQRESALLRALGLGVGQLRGMLAVEAVLVAVVAAVLGVGLGVAYAWTGVMALGVEATRVPMHLVVPRQQLGLVVGAAVLAGAVASVLPGRRAARVSPAEALTVD